MDQNNEKNNDSKKSSEIDALKQSIDSSAKEALQSSKKKTAISIVDGNENEQQGGVDLPGAKPAAKPVKIAIDDDSERNEENTDSIAEPETDSDQDGLTDEAQTEDLEEMGYTEQKADDDEKEADENDGQGDDVPGDETDENKQESVDASDTTAEDDTTEEEPKKVAGPLGPYQPKTTENDTATTDVAEDNASESDIDDLAIDIDEPSSESRNQNKPKTSSEPVTPVKDDKDVDSLLNLDSQAAQSSAAAAAASAANKTKKPPGKIKRFFKAWWNKKPARYTAFFAVFVVFAAVALVPVLRYEALNLVGVRVDSSLYVVDSQTGLPLENIPVVLSGDEKRTNEDGYVEYEGRRLGKTKLVINKLGYADYEKDVTLGLGSNPLNEQPLIATGAQYVFELFDFLSDEKLTVASAKSGEDVAKSNDEGEIRLTVGDLSPGAEVVLSADGYRDEAVELSSLLSESNEITMVPAKKHVFVSNRTGEYDLYKIDIDGQNEEILLPSTGKEREIPYVLPHPDKNTAAYISSRDGEQNKDGFIYDGLFIVDVDGDESDVIRVTRSEQLQIIGWIGDKLVYVAVVEGVSAGNSQRSKLFSYDTETTERVELATSNYFNDVKIAGDKVFYAVSSFALPDSQAKLYSIDSDGQNKEKVVDTQVWSIIRSDFNTLLLNAINRQWFELPLDNVENVEKLENQPANTPSVNYAVSPDGKQALWTDVRDGKGVLLRYDVESESDEIITSAPGLGVPAYWLASNNYVVYRITTSEETADYVLNLDGGEPLKIADVVGNRSRYFY